MTSCSNGERFQTLPKLIEPPLAARDTVVVAPLSVRLFANGVLAGSTGSEIVQSPLVLWTEFHTVALSPPDVVDSIRIALMLRAVSVALLMTSEPVSRLSVAVGVSAPASVGL